MKNITLTSLLLGVMLLAACAGAGAQLAGSGWQLSQLNGRPLPADVQIGLEFKDGRASGSAACNTYGAMYAQSGAQLTFEQSVTTMMFCDGLMDYERDYLAALANVRSFQLEDDVLQMLDENGVALLVFVKR